MTGTPTQLTDKTGRVVFEGTQDGGGGSGGPALQVADFLFTEQPAAGTYTASLPLPAGTTVLDVFVYNLGLWDSSDPLLTVGDSGGSVDYFNALDLATMGRYDPGTSPDPNGGGATSLGGNAAGQLGPAAYAKRPGETDDPGVGAFYPADDVLSFTITSTFLIGTLGVTLVRVLYFPPITPTAATFTP